MSMVQYWKKKESVQAKVMRDKDGSIVMKMEGEDHIFPGFPRGHLLFGSLSKLKHEIKNRLFNDNWWKLENGISPEIVIKEFKKSFTEILKLVEIARYDMVAPSRMVKSVKEIWRAMEVLEEKCPKIKPFKEIMTFVLQEDDAYRFRLQWMIQIFNPSSWWFKLLFRDPIKDFDLALQEMENAEIIYDMKERIRLFRRITSVILEDKRIQDLFLDLCKEMDWNKLKLSEADKFHFRGKWFRVDLMYFEY